MSNVITICGSMQFADQMKRLQQKLDSKSRSVYIPDDNEPNEGYDSLDEAGQVTLKGRFIDAHLEKIKRSDAILIANFAKNGVDGYVGANTLMEMAFAYALEKQIFVLNVVGDQGCRLEVLGMQPVILNGDLGLLMNE